MQLPGNAKTVINYKSDRLFRGLLKVEIVSLSRDEIQREITRLTNWIDENGGSAVFLGPGRYENGYRALGELNLNEVSP